MANLTANYFEVVAHKDLMLFRYSIEIMPVGAGAGKGRKGSSSSLLNSFLSNL